MTRREEKHRRKRQRWEQENALRQKRQKLKRFCLQLLSWLFLLVGGACFLAQLFFEDLGAIFCTFAALCCWTASAWCNWGLAPNGTTVFVWGHRYQYNERSVEHRGNLTVALILSIITGIFALIIAVEFLCFSL